MTEEQLAAVEALCNAATVGPWSIEYDGNEQANIYSGHEWIAILPHQCVLSIEEQRAKDAGFIAASRTLVLQLIAELREARAYLDDSHVRAMNDANEASALCASLAAERDRLREMLEWLDRGGGLGLGVHARIRAAMDVKP